MTGTKDNEEHPSTMISKGDKPQTKKRGLRSIEEVEKDLRDAARFRDLGKARGEDRSTSYLDGSMMDRLLAERHYLAGE